MLGGRTVTGFLNEIENLLKDFFFSFRLSTFGFLVLSRRDVDGETKKEIYFDVNMLFTFWLLFRYSDKT